MSNADVFSYPDLGDNLLNLIDGVSDSGLPLEPRFRAQDEWEDAVCAAVCERTKLTPAEWKRLAPVARRPWLEAAIAKAAAERNQGPRPIAANFHPDESDALQSEAEILAQLQDMAKLSAEGGSVSDRAIISALHQLREATDEKAGSVWERLETEIQAIAGVPPPDRSIDADENDGIFHRITDDARSFWPIERLWTSGTWPALRDILRSLPPTPGRNASSELNSRPIANKNAFRSWLKDIVAFVQALPDKNEVVNERTNTHNSAELGGVAERLHELANEHAPDAAESCTLPGQPKHFSKAEVLGNLRRIISLFPTSCTLGELIAILERREQDTTFVDAANLKESERIAAQSGSIAAGAFLMQAAAFNAKPTLPWGPDVDRIELLCDTKFDEPGLKTANVRKLRAEVCQTVRCSKEAASQFDLDRVADILEGVQHVPITFQPMNKHTPASNVVTARTCDVGVVTVINPELSAVFKQLGIDRRAGQPDEGDLFWETSVVSRVTGLPLRIVVHCVGKAGNVAASNAATKLIERWHPKMMMLTGISAGRRDKVKIGDVVLSLAVVDHTVTVAEDGKRHPRILVSELRHVVRQMWHSFEVNEKDWHVEFSKVFTQLPEPPTGWEEEYKRHVAQQPKHHYAVDASADILLRDSEILESLAANVHQQIRVGDMEASGFVQACEARHPPIPWVVVRGVSDFGDSFKNDEFHRMAACAAASFLSYFMRDGVNVSLLVGKREDAGVEARDGGSGDEAAQKFAGSINENPDSIKQTPALSELEFAILVAVGKQHHTTAIQVATAVHVSEEKAKFYLDELERKHRLLDWFANMNRSIPERYELTHEGRRLLVERGVFD